MKTKEKKKKSELVVVVVAIEAVSRRSRQWRDCEGSFVSAFQLLLPIEKECKKERKKKKEKKGKVYIRVRQM